LRVICQNVTCIVYSYGNPDLVQIPWYFEIPPFLQFFFVTKNERVWFKYPGTPEIPLFSHFFAIFFITKMNAITNEGNNELSVKELVKMHHELINMHKETLGIVKSQVEFVNSI